MNATLKSVCDVVRQDDPELQQAAIRVLGAIRAREPAVYRVLGELLAETSNPLLIGALLETCERNPSEHSLKYLLKIVDREDEFQDRVLGAITAIGGRGVGAIKQQFDRVGGETRAQLVHVLARIRTGQAHALLIECFFSADSHLVREAVHAVREEIHQYDNAARADLYNRLSAALKDKRLARNEAALSAVIITLGILADVRCKTKLLAYLNSENDGQIRRYALISLARLTYAGDRHQDVLPVLLPILTESDYEGIVRHAIAVLLRLKPRRADNATYQELLNSPHVGVQGFAMQTLAHLDNMTNAQKVLEFTRHKEPHLRDTAREALRHMPSVVPVILKHLDEIRDPVMAREMVKVLAGHGNRIKADRAREMARRMLELFHDKDEHYRFYLEALRHLDGDTLQKAVLSRAARAWQKKNYANVCRFLDLLDDTGLLAAESQYQLAIASLKSSRKLRSRTSRVSDPCLEQIAAILRESPKTFTRTFLTEGVLEPEDVLYVGFHFSEHLNAERRFGGDLLRHVVKKWPRQKVAKIAQQKLKVEGH